jgi:hypothetical protein
MKKAKGAIEKNFRANSGFYFPIFISLCLLAAGIFSFINHRAQAQTGGNFTITQSVIAGGGQNSAGGAFSVDGTVGQAVAGANLTGGMFSLAVGFWTFNPFAGQGFESDVAPRNGGDGVVQSNDVVQVQRFQIGLDLPFQTNELQRADSAPFSSKGDNLLQSNDVVQTQRYQIGLETLQNAAGPGALVETIAQNEALKPEETATEIIAFEPPKPLSKKTVTTATATLAHRRVQVQNASASAGQQVQVNILVDADGDESAYGFRVSYNQTILTNPVTAIGTAGGSRLCNTATAGQINCSINNFPDNNPSSSTDQIGEIHTGDNQQLLRITFTIAASAPGGMTPITLSNVNASNDAANNLTITSQNGSVTVLGPTATIVNISGRVTRQDGRGVPRVRVVLQDVSTGLIKTVQTNPFGYFQIQGLEIGHFYILTARSKRHQFTPENYSLTLMEDLTEINFTALESESPDPPVLKK